MFQVHDYLIFPSQRAFFHLQTLFSRDDGFGNWMECESFQLSMFRWSFQSGKLISLVIYFLTYKNHLNYLKLFLESFKHVVVLQELGFRIWNTFLSVRRQLWNCFNIKLFEHQPLWQVLVLARRTHIRSDWTWPWSWNIKIGLGLCHWVLIRSPQLQFYAGWRNCPRAPSTILVPNVIMEGEVCWWSRSVPRPG